MAKKTKPTEGQSLGPMVLYRYMGWLVLTGAWLLLVAALVSYDPLDPPNPNTTGHHGQAQNWVGHVGATVAFSAYDVIGLGVWIGVAGMLAFLAAAALGKRISQPFLRVAGIVLMMLTTSAIIRLSLPASFDWPEGSRDLVAFYVNDQLTQRFNGIGTLMILMLGFWLGAILAVDHLVLLVPRYLGRALVLAYRMSPRMDPRPALAGRFSGLWQRQREEADRADPTGRGLRRRPEVDEPIDEDAGGLGGTEPFDPDAHRKGAKAAAKPDDEEELQAELDEEAAEKAEGDEESAGGPAADAPGAFVAEKKFDPDALRAKIKKLPIKFAAPPGSPGNAAPSKPAPAREMDLTGYRFPGMDLLLEPEGNFSAEIEKIVRDQAVTLESALQQYRIEGEVVGIDSGPVITLYELRLAPGTKVAALNAVSSDLARSLKAQNIRIVPNMAGKDTVGIEVPNIKKERVRLKELMTVQAEATGKMMLPMFLGKDASGNPLIQDLASMPHMLIAGTTGSGKSVCMNSIIMSFLFTKRPDELRLVLVDPKMVEMSMFKDIPHLMCPVVTEMSKAAAILEWATTKMDERYELLAEAGVRDIASYNGLGWEELKDRFSPASEAEEARIPKKLPYMVFIIDELADMMLTNKEVESFIVRLAQKARAVGIHLILATQRPQANVVTGLIKGNMPCRVSFKVASGLDSRIVLDQKGAEVLLGQGDMLFLSPRSSKLTRAQGTLVDDLEIRKSVKFLKEIAQQNFEPQLVQLRGASGGGGGEGGEGGETEERDPLFDDAVRIVLETKRGSVSLLQRRLTIGYGRASRLVEQMGQAGIIGEYKGSQARETLITVEEWEAMKAQAEADAAAGEAKGTVFDRSVDSPEPGKSDWANEGDEEDDDAVPDEFDGEHLR